MKKQLIALFGVGDAGKTTTIRKVRDLLLAKYIDAKEETLNGRLRVEIFSIITIKGKRIGITSRGDRDIHVKFALEKFAQEKCQIILCATRTKGSGSWNAMEKFAAKHQYTIREIQKIKEQIKAKQDNANKKDAATIVKIIRDSLI